MLDKIDTYVAQPEEGEDMRLQLDMKTSQHSSTNSKFYFACIRAWKIEFSFLFSMVIKPSGTLQDRCLRM